MGQPPNPGTLENGH